MTAHSLHGMSLSKQVISACLCDNFSASNKMSKSRSMPRRAFDLSVGSGSKARMLANGCENASVTIVSARYLNMESNKHRRSDDCFLPLGPSSSHLISCRARKSKSEARTPSINMSFHEPFTKARCQLKESMAPLTFSARCLYNCSSAVVARTKTSTKYSLASVM